MNISHENLIIFLENYFLILGSLFIIGIAYLISRANSDGKSTTSIPGNLGIPFIGEGFSFLSAANSSKGCYEFVRLRRLRHGDWFKTRMFGKIHVFVPSVEGAKKIYTNDLTMFNKGYLKSMADAAGKKSLFSVPQESHKRIRRLLSDSFSMNSLSIFVPIVDKMITQRLNNLERDGKSFGVFNFSTKMTFAATCKMLMSITDASLVEQIERDITAVSNAVISFPVMIPGTTYYKGIKARKRIMKTFKEMIGKRRNGEENLDDFLQRMIERDSYPNNEKLDDEEIMDNLLTMMLSGQNTTAAAMMWSVKFLSDHTDVQDKLREEQVSILRSKPEGTLLTLKDLEKMSYASKVIKETLRMANIVLWIPRVALENCTIDGIEIKRGWHVNIDAPRIHFDPETYKDPFLFNPSRWDEMQKPYSYIPWGTGPRTCLGMNMAKITMLAFLHRLTSGYKWTVDDEDPRLDRKSFIPRLQSGCPITLAAL